MHGEVTVHKSIDTLAEGSSKLIRTEYVNSLIIGGMPNHHLRIKKIESLFVSETLKKERYTKWD